MRSTITVAILAFLVAAGLVWGVVLKAREPAPPPPSDHEELIVPSPMAGLFSLSEMPGEPPLVKVGDRVKSGTLLGTVDNMRVRAMMSGTITEIMASDGAMVAAGQPLFRIRKS